MQVLRPPVGLSDVGRVVANNEEHAAGGNGVRGSAQYETTLCLWKVQVDDGDEVERARRRCPAKHIGGDPIDGQIAAVGHFTATIKRDLGEVNGSHLSSATRQPKRVSALAAGQVKRSAGRARFHLTHQEPARVERPQGVSGCIPRVPHLTIHDWIMPVRSR